MTLQSLVRRLVAPVTLLIMAAALSGQTPAKVGRAFYADDPIAREPETQDAAGAVEWEIELAYDLALNLFTRPGDPRPDVPAGNVNTIDEVPDSNWFTNRIGTRAISVEEASRGPNTMAGPAAGRWTVVAAKSAGFAPGFTVRDERNELWFVSLDGKGQPEAATGAIAVASKLFWALGYYQVESYLTSFRPDQLVIGETATVTPPSGKRRPMRMSDVEAVLARAHRSPDGSYRVLAGRGVSGKPIGGFEYLRDAVRRSQRRRAARAPPGAARAQGVRCLDQPRRHESRKHAGRRREGGRALGHPPLPPGCRLDVRHRSGRAARVGRRLRVPVRGQHAAEASREPGVLHPALADGRLPTPPGDRPLRGRSIRPRGLAVAGARRRRAARPRRRHLLGRPPGHGVLRRADSGDRQSRGYSDPAAEKHLADVLIERRDHIGRAYLAKVNPLVGFALDPTGTLTFENAAVRTGAAAPPARGYRAEWSTYDRAGEPLRSLGAATTSTTERMPPPAGLAAGAGSFVVVAVSLAQDASGPAPQPLDVYFRRTGSGWQLVGVEGRNRGHDASDGTSSQPAR